MNDSNSNSNSNSKRSTLLLTYFIAIALLFADQNALAPNLTAIAKDFELDDEARDEYLGGGIALAFFVCGAPASLIIGSIIDNPDYFNFDNNNSSSKGRRSSISRSGLLGGLMLLGEGACLATYLVQNIQQLVVCRALAGLSAGGAIPIVYSVLGDVYARHERARVAAIVSCGVGLGVALGQGVAGYIGSRYGWRLSFVIIATPALFCAIFLLLFVQQYEFDTVKARGMMEHCDCNEEDCDCNTGIDTYMDRDGDDADSDNDNRTNETLLLRNNSCLSSSSGGSSGDFDNNNDHSELLLSDFRDHLSQLSSSSLSRKQQYDDDDYLSSSSSLEAQILGEEYSFGSGDNNSSSQYNKTRSFRQKLLNACCSGAKSASLKDEKHFLKPHSVKLLLAQGSVGCLPWGVVNTYLNDYLAEDRGMSVDDATSTLLVFGIGLFLGVVVGGLGAEYTYRIRVHFPIILGGLANIVGCFPMYFLVNHVSGSSSIFVIGGFSIVAGICLAINSPIVKSTLTNVTLPTNRGRAFSYLNIFDELGKGLGPMIISLFISRLGRKQAFNISLLGWVLSGLLNLGAGYFVEADEKRVRKYASRAITSTPAHHDHTTGNTSQKHHHRQQQTQGHDSSSDIYDDLHHHINHVTLSRNSHRV